MLLASEVTVSVREEGKTTSSFEESRLKLEERLSNLEESPPTMSIQAAQMLRCCRNGKKRMALHTTAKSHPGVLALRAIEGAVD
mmetsp:Transcript_18039/g.45209  ORF Transcript_18039/g.45209 Transcript_18039/m.45209 type:complete len:84 (-) Transcript_18039:325-576(-)